MYDNASTFTDFVNKGDLCIPSTLILKVVSLYVEQVFRCYVPSATPQQHHQRKKAERENGHRSQPPRLT